MRNLNQYIIERLKLNANTKIQKHIFYPKHWKDLRKLLEKLIDERGPDADLNDIDISHIDIIYDPHDYSDHMLGGFAYLNIRNIDISNWDVSHIKIFDLMFIECKNFTGKCIENWKPINCERTDHMFDRCTHLNYKLLENWKLNKKCRIECMFGYKNDELKNCPSWWYKKENRY